mmetsp:Transcript_12366/g.33236  ORF Transcript_12366/g.33236 Transcript_12366/m.33236 type:complete len:121 (-) Transcript_12366:35-397(-)
MAMNREISASARSIFTEDEKGLPPSRIAKHALGDMRASQDEPCFASRLWFNDLSDLFRTSATPGHIPIISAMGERVPTLCAESSRLVFNVISDEIIALVLFFAQIACAGQPLCHGTHWSV